MTRNRRHGIVGFILAIFRGLNVVRIIVLNLVFFALLGLFFLAGGTKKPPLQEHTLLVLHPEGRLVEQSHVSPLRQAVDSLSRKKEGQVRVRDLTRVITHAAEDPHIQAILLKPEKLSISGFAAVDEVGHALNIFRASGKKVIAWAPSLNQQQYLLAAYADKVYLDPMGGIDIRGLSSYRLFFKDLLDKLGVHVHLFRVGQYKSAAEPFILDHASAAAKKADRYWLNNLWSQWMTSVAHLRGLDVDQWRQHVAQWPVRLVAAKGDIAKLAQSMKLVDGTMTPAQLQQSLRQQGIAPGKSGQGIRRINMASYLAYTPLPRAGADSDVAIVVAEGAITSGKSTNGQIGSASVVRMLKKAGASSSVKAVVLRINSPGGAVYPAEQIRRAVERIRQAGKPVVVSMGNMAASGGYWIGMNANKIIASPDTITGSIGIFGLLYNVPDTLEKIGVHNDGVGVGPLAGAFDVTRPLSKQAAAIVQSTVDRGYRQFVTLVAEARHKSVDQIQEVAQGRVWTGAQAKRRGLVDKLGGLSDAVHTAANLAHLGKHYTSGYVSPQQTGWGRLVQRLNHSIGAQLIRAHGIYLPAWLTRAVYPSVATYHLFSQAEAGTSTVYAYCTTSLNFHD